MNCWLKYEKIFCHNINIYIQRYRTIIRRSWLFRLRNEMCLWNGEGPPACLNGCYGPGGTELLFRNHGKWLWNGRGSWNQNTWMLNAELSEFNPLSEGCWIYFRQYPNRHCRCHASKFAIQHKSIKQNASHIPTNPLYSVLNPIRAGFTLSNGFALNWSNSNVHLSSFYQTDRWGA